MTKLSPSSRLIAIDPSLTVSGWALFSVSSAKPLCCGVISPPGNKLSMSERLLSLQLSVFKLLSFLELGASDILVSEGPAPLVLNPDSALKVERVRSIFESSARTLGMKVPGRINPRTLQSELLGMRGPQLARAEVKACARGTAEKLFGDALETLPRYSDPRPKTSARKGKRLSQDIIDALLIGSLAVSRAKLSISSNVSLDLVFENKGRPGGRRGGSRWSEKDLAKHLA